MDYPEKRKTPARIFVSSMGDLFGEWVPDIWIEDVFAACKRAPQHTYLFLTKNPQRYLDMGHAGKLPMERNFWYGTTITSPETEYFGASCVNTFLSIEPLLEPFSADDCAGFRRLGEPLWVIIGAMTGPGSKRKQPKREWVEAITEVAQSAGGPRLYEKQSERPVGRPSHSGVPGGHGTGRRRITGGRTIEEAKLPEDRL